MANNLKRCKYNQNKKMIPADKCEPLDHMISESASGNQKMQQLLYKKYAPLMYSICLRYTKNAVEAEDILQEGFIKVFRNLHNFRGNGCFEGWLKKIICHTAISYFRSSAKKMREDSNKKIVRIGLKIKLPSGDATESGNPHATNIGR